MQLPLQSVVPVGQAHLLPTHMRPAGHLFPQAPQLFSSLATVTHEPLQSVVPFGQVHLLAAQLGWSFGHSFPHAPQLLGSPDVSSRMHLPLQSTLGALHAHVPLLQSSPAGHDVSQPPQ
jgi:hypothetical protein